MPTPKSATLLLFAALTIPCASVLAQTPPAAAPAKPAAAAPAKSFVTVNGIAIPQYMADAFAAELRSAGAPDTPEFRNAVREEMIRRGALVSEAKKRGLDKNTEFKRQLELAEQVLLMRQIVADELQKHPVTAEELQAATTAALARWDKTEYKLRHIQSNTEADAKAVLAKLTDSKKFDKLAKEHSTDAGTKDSGGDLGWKQPSILPPAVNNVIQELKKGEFTKAPVQSDVGWHLLYLEDQRPLTPPPVTELQPRLIQALQQQKAAQFIDTLRAAATVK